LVLPLAVLALLWWAKTECNHGGQCQLPVLEGWGGPMPKGDFATTCTEGLPLTGDSGKQLGFSECDAWTDYFNRPVTTLEVLGYLHWTGKRLGLAAEKAEDIPKVEFVRDWITQHWFGEMYLDHIPCTVWLEKDVVDKFTRRMKPPSSPSSNQSVLDHCPTNRSGTLPGFAALTGDVVHKADDLQSYFDSTTYGYGNQTNYYGPLCSALSVDRVNQGRQAIGRTVSA
jgi:hypothetical protein